MMALTQIAIDAVNVAPGRALWNKRGDYARHWWRVFNRARLTTIAGGDQRAHCGFDAESIRRAKARGQWAVEIENPE